MRFIFLLFIIVSMSFSQTKFSSPLPSFDHPRKMIIQVSTNNDDDINHIFSSIANILKEYQTGTIEIAVVCYYHGLKVLRKDEENIRKRVESLMMLDVEFIACDNTMQSKKWERKDMLDNITYVQSGLTEVLERVTAGWINIRP